MSAAGGLIDHEARGGPAIAGSVAWLSKPVPRRYLVVGLVALIHLLVLWALAVAIRPLAPVRSGSTELQVQLLSPNLGPRQPLAPPLDWDFDAPEQVLVPEPQITIEPDLQEGQGIVGAAISQRLAPRLDPKHTNARPELPRTMGGIIAALSVELHILVLPDGTVADARVSRSAGESDLDRLAIQTVENSWRYLPASINGKPIEAWTTVIVRFAPFG
jgi:TonB family protein